MSQILDTQTLGQQTAVAQVITELLKGKATTFAQVNYVSDVKTAAAHKALKIIKQTSANVQLFSDINAATSVFSNAVKKSAGKIESNNQESVNAFQVQDTYYTHTDCYSIVEHKKNANLYLYCIYNKAKSQYFIDGQPVTKDEIRPYLTASDAKRLFESDGKVHNVANDITHDVTVRTIALHNITGINACNESLTF